MAIIETAIILPILLLITLGVIHFAWLFLKAHQITSVARHGARLAALEGANEGNVETEIRTLLSNAGIKVVKLVEFLPGSVDGHDSVTVRITVEGSKVALLNFNNSILFPLLTPANLVGAVTMVKEGS